MSKPKPKPKDISNDFDSELEGDFEAPLENGRVSTTRFSLDLPTLLFL